ncbi:hypothetical protein AB0E64_31630 [Streptomyces caelestis]|uniref:Uncharacterized protein n=1 Tax=Streptomyces caelestis TaxID=36816 RepID=A0A7W9LQ46_9ACTN|nr:hypothetical protein [Streptomyces caelestis]MBB5792103.1 hypothetical protein [Streptomyces caelestis]GGW79479.1 hypothetical protein GCM10010320_71850 [Streptomyces caelestis]
MLLRHDRAVIAARVLTARLRTARRTGRPLYGPAAHQPTAPHKQLLLFAQPHTAARPAVDLAALRTDLEALELTTDQIRRTGTAFATVGDEARRRVRKPANPNPNPNPEPAHPNPEPANQARTARRAHQPDEQSAHRPYQPRTARAPARPDDAHRRGQCAPTAPGGFAIAHQVRTVPGIRRAHPLQVLGAHRLQVLTVSSPSC